MITIFFVSVQNAVAFADTVIENNLQTNIIGTDDEDLIHFEVEHSRQDRDAIDQLAEFTEPDE